MKDHYKSKPVKVVNTRKRIFILPVDMDERLRKEAYRTKRSRSDIVREALGEYFSYKTT